MKYPPFPNPDAYRTFHLTFTCYGTWLLGSEKGSTRHGGGYVAPCPNLEEYMRDRCNYSSVTLSKPLRLITFNAIENVCAREGWILQALNTLGQHVHAVVTVGRDDLGSVVLGKLKSEATRELRAVGFRQTQPIWTRSGNCKEIKTYGYFCRAVKYVTVEQTESSFHNQQSVAEDGRDHTESRETSFDE